ncbi:MAG: hypothetical protein PHI32_10815 [Dysgonamonadaceae bacterium]|nr:hypothetical protein [Dysgonamonadaceae bacterium]MDD4728494.1 hypothetical protein [Dysgonamonadaceae bacterium]
MNNMFNTFLLMVFFSLSQITEGQEIKLELSTIDDSLETHFNIPVKMKLMVRNNLLNKIHIIEPEKFIGETSINQPWEIAIIDKSNYQYCSPIVIIADKFQAITIKKGQFKEFNILLDISKLVNCANLDSINLFNVDSLQITVDYKYYRTQEKITSNSIVFGKTARADLFPNRCIAKQKILKTKSSL